MKAEKIPAKQLSSLFKDAKTLLFLLLMLFCVFVFNRLIAHVLLLFCTFSKELYNLCFYFEVLFSCAAAGSRFPLSDSRSISLPIGSLAETTYLLS